MRAAAVTVQVFFFALALVGAGCEPAPAELPTAIDGGAVRSSYTAYTPTEVDILPLTEFVGAGETEEPAMIRVYVSLLDTFDCQIKAPGTFRFELYERVQRRAEPKGRRIIIWPDIDLTDAAENNSYWRDFLRAYKFGLDFEPQSNRNYILQATFLCPSGRRLSAEFAIKIQSDFSFSIR